MRYQRTFDLVIVLFTLFSVSLIALIYLSDVCASSTFLDKIATTYIILLAVAIAWCMVSVSRHFARFESQVLDKYETSEKLLLDLRDGTHNVFKEKRRSLRVKTDLTAKLMSENVCDYIKTIDLSYDGAQLKTSKPFKVGDIINLDLYLPLFPKPIAVRVMVMRVIPTGDEAKPDGYQIGVKYLAMPKDARQKLVETLDALAKESRGQSPK